MLSQRRVVQYLPRIDAKYYKLYLNLICLKPIVIAVLYSMYIWYILSLLALIIIWLLPKTTLDILDGLQECLIHVYFFLIVNIYSCKNHLKATNVMSFSLIFFKSMVSDPLRST